MEWSEDGGASARPLNLVKQPATEPGWLAAVPYKRNRAMDVQAVGVFAGIPHTTDVAPG